MEPVVRIASASTVDAAELAAVAARTFPLACPPSVELADVASFIDANLSDARFAEYLADPQRQIFTAAREGRIIGYAMLIRGVSDDPEVQRAVDMILGGAKFITTNRDPSPKKPGWNNLGIAATTAMIEEASGRKAFVTGKPSPVMMRSARKFLGLETAETTVIGDTMETDIQGGVQMGYKTILVLSGIAKKEDLSHYAFKPDLVVASVEEIQLPLKWW